MSFTITTTAKEAAKEVAKEAESLRLNWFVVQQVHEEKCASILFAVKYKFTKLFIKIALVIKIHCLLLLLDRLKMS